jgi:2-polyprenyl-6-methoxyphenol hydroxylase-like FAD-dependent oxidoreductase
MPGERFDIVVVGARCAGSALATLLARAGLRVCLIDRARFPSDTPSTHAIHATGVKVLERLGVLEPLLESTPRLDRATVAFDELQVEVNGITELLGAPIVSARRVVLDHLLVEAAARAGADVRTGTVVTELVEDRGRVAGVRTRVGTIRAPLVVGADGVRSTVARLVGARETHRTRSERTFLWAYFKRADADEDRLWIGIKDNQGFLATPTDDGLFMVAVVASGRAGREDHAGGLARWPELAATVANAEHVGPVRVMNRLDGYFRASAGPGWALVGDAGHFKDPVPGQGISDALRQAVALAEAIERGGDLALRDWWSWRDRDAWEMYWLAHDMGAAGPPPLLVQEMQRRIAGDPRRMADLLRVLNHDIPPSRLFTPSLGVPALAGALRRRRGGRLTVLREAVELTANDVRRRRAMPRAPRSGTA